MEDEISDHRMLIDVSSDLVRVEERCETRQWKNTFFFNSISSASLPFLTRQRLSLIIVMLHAIWLCTKMRIRSYHTYDVAMKDTAATELHRPHPRAQHVFKIYTLRREVDKSEQTDHHHHLALSIPDSCVIWSCVGSNIAAEWLNEKKKENEKNLSMFLWAVSLITKLKSLTASKKNRCMYGIDLFSVELGRVMNVSVLFGAFDVAQRIFTRSLDFAAGYRDWAIFFRYRALVTNGEIIGHKKLSENSWCARKNSWK